MPPTIWIAGNQLPAASNILRDIPKETRVLMVESRTRGSLFRYHKKKLVLVYSAMRHFARELRTKGWRVDYHTLKDTPSFELAFRKHIKRYSPSSFITLAPADHPQLLMIREMEETLGVPFDVRPNDLFLTTPEAFRAFAADRSALLMETYYRSMRKRYNVLMDDGGAPAGGSWNLDKENRRPYSAEVRPGPWTFPAPDALTRSVIRDVETYFPDHPGTAKDFRFPVTRRQALAHLRRFIRSRLPQFGPYEDMMAIGQPHLHHSLLSPLLNLGLLHPLEVIRAAEQAHASGRAALNSVEGFVRQILGWREFIYGVYWLRMPAYRTVNALHADRRLPAFFYDGSTPMNCLRQVIGQTIDEGYAHHIQRLMVLANFCTLAGIAPSEVYRWFMEMYIDAYDWVMVPNVLGMGLHADGGTMSTKPYVSSGSYIARMSNYCRACSFDVKQKTGETACPFNYLYWDFLDRHRTSFRGNHRMTMMYRVLDAKKRSEVERIRSDAQQFLEGLR